MGLLTPDASFFRRFGESVATFNWSLNAFAKQDLGIAEAAAAQLEMAVPNKSETTSPREPINYREVGKYLAENPSTLFNGGGARWHPGGTIDELNEKASPIVRGEVFFIKNIMPWLEELKKGLLLKFASGSNNAYAYARNITLRLQRVIGRLDEFVGGYESVAPLASAGRRDDDLFALDRA